MWVFGYGSLMWDEWETKVGCTRSVLATLPGYVRAFNKASVRNWGSQQMPGPTLNLVPGEGGCVGMAFEFPNDRSQEVLNYLREREGAGFKFYQKVVRLGDGAEVESIVGIYEGDFLINVTSIEEVAALVRRAHGRDGSCREYVVGILNKLRDLQIDDPIVTNLHRLIED
jgi:cation transport protein ChaC